MYRGSIPLSSRHWHFVFLFLMPPNGEKIWHKYQILAPPPAPQSPLIPPAPSHLPTLSPVSPSYISLPRVDASFYSSHLRKASIYRRKFPCLSNLCSLAMPAPSWTQGCSSFSMVHTSAGLLLPLLSTASKHFSFGLLLGVSRRELVLGGSREVAEVLFY